jgi:hypothetical protein
MAALLGVLAACGQAPRNDPTPDPSLNARLDDDERAAAAAQPEQASGTDQNSLGPPTTTAQLLKPSSDLPGEFRPMVPIPVEQTFVRRRPFEQTPATGPATVTTLGPPAGASLGPATGPGLGRRTQEAAKPALTQLASFDNSPFPYMGPVPASARPFLNYQRGGRAGHQTTRGRTYWADETYNERRSLLHVPPDFDIDRTAAIVLFFHGHRARLERDVWKRYGTASQISLSGSNAVLVAPQFAVGANDSSIGQFWRPGKMASYLDEAAERLARMIGQPQKTAVFRSLPIIVVAYSGGFEAAGYALKAEELRGRIQGVVLLDAAYGHLDTFARAVAHNRQRFLISAWSATGRGNSHLSRRLRELGVTPKERLPDVLRGGDAIVVHAPTPHENYVRDAWTENPIADVLRRIPVLNKRVLSVAQH